MLAAPAARADLGMAPELVPFQSEVDGHALNQAEGSGPGHGGEEAKVQEAQARDKRPREEVPREA